jgi:cardiolipin synthase
VESAAWLAFGVLAADLLLRIGTAVRVVFRRYPTGVSFSWLTLVLLVPFLGALVYWVVGENRRGIQRATRERELRAPYRAWQQAVLTRSQAQLSQVPDALRGLHQEGLQLTGVPAMPGNTVEIHTEAVPLLLTIAAEIRAAEYSCNLLFYIWHPGGATNAVGEALIQAAGRGVTCRVLLDAIGSQDFLRSPLCRRMREAGVRVVEALPVHIWRLLLVRNDLRNHRKVVVIDGRCAYTGSMNLVDPRFFKVDAGVGAWIDLMLRITGPVVEHLAVVFAADWELETAEGLEALDGPGGIQPVTVTGSTPIQIVPSGPGFHAGSAHQLLLSALYAAQHELLITTPYFVPDDPFRAALVAAARRGVQVTLTVPAKVDSVLVRYASRSHFQDLLDAGVGIRRFRGGLLHTKALTVDGRLALIGTVNLDHRSFWLNFELLMAIYDSEVVGALRRVQLGYNDDADLLDPEGWRRRSLGLQFLENLAALAAPIL